MINYELKRLMDSEYEGKHDLVAIDYLINSSEEPGQIINRIKEVLLILNKVFLKKSEFESVNWKNELPKWFIAKFRPERTEKEKKEYIKWWDSLSISNEEKNKQGQKKQIWSLKNWLHWMDPERREWYWYYANILTDDEVILTILVYGHPFPDGALKWLVEAAGCFEIVEA